MSTTSDQAILRERRHLLLLESDSEEEANNFRPAKRPDYLDDPDVARALRDPRFNPPTPSPFKRLLLILFVIALFWMAISLRLNIWRAKRGQQVSLADGCVALLRPYFHTCSNSFLALVASYDTFRDFAVTWVRCNTGLRQWAGHRSSFIHQCDSSRLTLPTRYISEPPKCMSQ
jgi:hypothetical protein